MQIEEVVAQKDKKIKEIEEIKQKLISEMQELLLKQEKLEEKIAFSEKSISSINMALEEMDSNICRGLKEIGLNYLVFLISLVLAILLSQNILILIWGIITLIKVPKYLNLAKKTNPKKKHIFLESKSIFLSELINYRFEKDNLDEIIRLTEFKISDAENEEKLVSDLKEFILKGYQQSFDNSKECEITRTRKNPKISLN